MGSKIRDGLEGGADHKQKSSDMERGTLKVTVAENEWITIFMVKTHPEIPVVVLGKGFKKVETFF